MIKKIYKALIPEKTRIKNRLLFGKVISVFYSGNRLKCNCCGKTFSKFKSKGSVIKRADAECPYCGSLERTRLLLFYLQRETSVFDKKLSLLHFAPEWCLIPIFKRSRNINYVTADINPNYAEHEVNIEDTPFRDDFF